MLAITNDVKRTTYGTTVSWSDVSVSNEVGCSFVDYAYIIDSGFFGTKTRTIIDSGEASGGTRRTLSFIFKLVNRLESSLNATLNIYTEYGEPINSFTFSSNKDAGDMLTYKINITNESGKLLIGEGYYKAVFTSAGCSGYELNFAIYSNKA